MDEQEDFRSMTKHTDKTPKASYILLILGIILIAANLRPAITSVGPLIEMIRDELNISHGLAGLLTTLPLLAFAVFSTLAPKFSQRFGNETVLFVGLITLITGILIRSTPLVAALFIGTFILGTAIAVCNVLLPGLIKHHFPAKVGLMTGIYSTFMGAFAALGSGISVPLVKDIGMSWRGALASWAVWVAIAAVLWLPQLFRRSKPTNVKKVSMKLGNLWSSPLAWQVTIFMGLQSFIFYTTIAWLPELLHDRGLTVSAAGWMVSFMQFISLPATFLVPFLADRRPSQRTFVVLIGLLFITSLIGLLHGSMAWLALWVALLGIALGASISLALAFLGLRARNARQAAELSGMAQSIGYLLAAFGPVFFGFLHDLTQNWTIPLVLVLCISVLTTLSGLGAGRNAYVTPD